MLLWDLKGVYLMYNIPLFNLNFDVKEEDAVLEVIRSKWISSGPKCAELESKFAKMIGAKYALAVSNCTDALHLGVVASGIKEGDEVIVPSLTFVATVNCVKYAGGIPVFCDIESKERIVIDPRKIENLITEKTKAIIPMHFAGFPCDMDRIMHIAEKHNLKVIEDACHGPMSEFHGKKLGTIGDVGCFSFFSNKNISTGEGGIVVTNNQETYERIKLLRSHGMTSMSYERASGHSTSYDVVDLGYNYRMDDIRAAIGIAQLDKLVPDILRRKSIREKYISLLSDTDELIIPFIDWKEMSASYIFPVVLSNGNSEKRDSLRAFLAEKGIQTSIHYPPSHRFMIYNSLYKGNLPITEYVADNEFTLPMYGALTDEEIRYICEKVKEGLFLLKSN